MESNYNAKGNLQSSEAMKHPCQFNIFGRFNCHQFTVFCMQGARWDVELNTIADSRLKELHPEMPVMFLKAITQVRKL